MNEQCQNKSRVLQQVLSSLLFLFLLLGQGKAWLIPALLAWGCHEAAHVLAGMALGCPLRFFDRGYTLSVGHGCQGWRQAVLSAAGPGCNLFFAFFLPGEWGFCHLVMAVGNLLPALPLDGGRICRSFLAWALGWLGATRALAVSGMLLGCLFLYYGISQGGMGIFFGFLLLFLAGQEFRYATYYFWQALLIHRCKDGWQKRIFLPGDTLVKEAVGKLCPGYYCIVETGKSKIPGEVIINAFLKGESNSPISFLPKQDLP